MKIHHIGIATDSIEKTLEEVRNDFEIKDVSDIVYDEKQDARLCMLTTMHNEKIELIEGEAVKNFLKRKQYLYHTCYEVKDIHKKIEEFRSSGAYVLSEPKEAVFFEGRKAVFIMTKLGLIELLEAE